LPVQIFQILPTKNNFKCPNTGEEFYIFSYKTKIVSGEEQFFDNNWKRISHPSTGTLLVPIEYKKEFTPDSIPQLMGFQNGSSLSKKEKMHCAQSERKVRNEDHFKKEVMPTMSLEDKVDHRKKYGDKNLGNTKV